MFLFVGDMAQWCGHLPQKETADTFRYRLFQFGGTRKDKVLVVVFCRVADEAAVARIRTAIMGNHTVVIPA